MDLGDMIISGKKSVGFIPNFEPLEMKESLGDGKKNIGFIIGENEDLIKENFHESSGVDIDWDLANKTIEILEHDVEDFVNKKIEHTPVEESHDDDGFFFGYWFELNDEKVLDFAREFAARSHDFDDSEEDETFYLENINDIIDDDVWDDICERIERACGEEYLTVIESCRFIMIAPKDIE